MHRHEDREPTYEMCQDNRSCLLLGTSLISMRDVPVCGFPTVMPSKIRWEALQTVAVYGCASTQYFLLCPLRFDRAVHACDRACAIPCDRYHMYHAQSSSLHQSVISASSSSRIEPYRPLRPISCSVYSLSLEACALIADCYSPRQQCSLMHCRGLT